jgi:putative ABC transport system permease protein
VFAQPFGELCLADYEPMRINCSVNPVAAIIGIVIPVIMYTLAAMFSVNRLLKTETVLLLNDNADQDKKNFKKVLVKKKISFRFKYAVRSLIGNPGRTFVVFFGVFIGSFIALFSFSILDTMDNTKNNMVDEMGSFEYQYVLNELIETNEYGGESLLMSTGENKSGDRFSIIGTTDDNPYLNMRDIKGNKINLENGYYITNVMAMLHELEEGDQFTVFNPLTLEEITIEIAGIIDNDMQNALFCSRKNASALLDLDDKLSNVIMSDKELAIPESKIMQVIKRQRIMSIMIM